MSAPSAPAAVVPAPAVRSEDIIARKVRARGASVAERRRPELCLRGAELEVVEAPELSCAALGRRANVTVA
jgi:hypothetical protein